MTYQEIFEQDARWLSGPSILTKIVKHLEGKSLGVDRVPACASELNVFVPLPLVHEELSGAEVSILAQVPPELISIFVGGLVSAVQEYLGEEGLGLLQAYRNQKITQDTLYRIRHALDMFEKERQARGDVERELRWVVAKHFGLNFNPTVQIIYG